MRWNTLDYDILRMIFIYVATKWTTTNTRLICPNNTAELKGATVTLYIVGSQAERTSITWDFSNDAISKRLVSAGQIVVNGFSLTGNYNLQIDSLLRFYTGTYVFTIHSNLTEQCISEVLMLVNDGVITSRTAVLILIGGAFFLLAIIGMMVKHFYRPDTTMHLTPQCPAVLSETSSNFNAERRNSVTFKPKKIGMSIKPTKISHLRRSPIIAGQSGLSVSPSRMPDSQSGMSVSQSGKSVSPSRMSVSPSRDTRDRHSKNKHSLI